MLLDYCTSTWTNLFGLQGRRTSLSSSLSSIPAFHSPTDSSPIDIPLTNDEEKGEPERNALPTEMTHCPGSSHGRLRQRQDIDAIIDLVRQLDTS